jgi:hypothetical protein
MSSYFVAGWLLRSRFSHPAGDGATHFVHRGRLRDQTLDRCDSKQRELDASVAPTPPHDPYGLQILHPNTPKTTVE